MKRFGFRLTCLFLIMLFVLCGCNNTQPVVESVASHDNLKVHFLDVGQGDSIFIELPDKETMLIDAGESKYSQGIIDYIKKSGYDRIDYLVATHPHSDHIGGMAKVINAFDIGTTYMTNAVSTSSTYEKLLQTVADKGKKMTRAKAGVNIKIEEGLEINFIAPVSDTYDDLNNYSAVIKLTYHNNSFIFTGDAQTESEKQITADLKADVLKVGHHGSTTSTSDAFLKKVSPKYAVILVGEGNDYGHPHKEILDRIQKNNVKVYRTDLDGTVVATSDGKDITFTQSKEQIDENSSTTDASKPTFKYVLNTSSKKIHTLDCSAVSKISSDNYGSTNDISKAIKDGYEPCKMCNPE